MDSRGAATASGSANPFKMRSEEEIYVLRDEEKRQKAMERERLKYQRVHEKTTWSARIGSAKLKTSVDGLDIIAETRPEPRGSSMGSGHHGMLDGSAATLPTVEARVKDNMGEFIKKKRKMGLARMSLATKRQEIKKLEEEADRAEKRISQLEAQIEDTSGKFKAFVKQSDMEQVEAQKRADHETKAKQEKMQEIKKLSAQIAQVEAERKKHDEQMDSCLEYKRFLDGLTPAPWFKETLFKIRCEDAKRQIDAVVEERLMELAVEAGEVGAEDEERRAAIRRDQEEQIKAANEAIAAQLAAMSPEDTRAALDQVDPDRVPMYFQHPDQLMQKFVETEEGNLFLITQCQELEVDIEKIASAYDALEQKMGRIQREKRSQIEDEKKKILAENKKIKELQDRVDADALTGGGTEQKSKQEKIETKVGAICKALQLGDDSVNALGLLTQIEVRFEEMRVYIEASVEKAHVQAVMRQREKERRSDARAAHLETEQKRAEERSAKAMRRSKAPVKKRVGKPVMWRSRPIDPKKQEAVTDDAANAQEDTDYFM